MKPDEVISHMAIEVAQAPEAVARFLDLSRPPLLLLAAQALRAASPTLVTTVARGSSDHAATYVKYAVELLAGIPVASVGPSVASIYGRPLSLAGAACIGISQSGRSPDIVSMMGAARAGGALTVAITNDAESPMAAVAAHALALQAGPERSVAATKTFVASIVAGLALLAEWQDDKALQVALRGLPEVLRQASSLDWSPLEARLSRAQSAYVLGRGPGLAIAGEAALKLKETCGLHAEAYSAAEVLHGPSAIVSAGFTVLVLAVEDAARQGAVATAERLASQGADVFITGTAASGAKELPMLKGLHPLVAPLVLTIPFYACVEALARRRGLDPDAPPNLCKVTETR